MNPVSRGQIVALQSLYAKWAGHAICEDERADRLAWASEETGRTISSFSDLTSDEARILIDALKGSLGQPVSAPPQPWRKVRSRDRAQAAGTAGRRGFDSTVAHIVSADDLARIDEAVRRLGWTREQYEAWLRSDRSPLGDKESATIRTVAEANKVWWALKNMLIRSGNWKPAPRRTRQTLRASA
jgi:hypothetical protein